MVSPTDDLQAAIAVTRFGLGARPGELAQVARDPKRWLHDQVRPAGADQPQTEPETAASRIQAFRAYQMDRRDMRRAADGKDDADPARDPVQIAARLIREGTAVDFLARARLGATTHAGFRERWALFWCNHFTVSGVKLVTATVVGPFEQEAIRPRVFGRFEDLLVSSTMHPGMLLYLDQAQSVGPNSQAAAFLKRQPRAAERVGVGGGLNENLAREIMELHTVGVDGGYSQADVTEFARALTGWSVGGLREPEERRGKFVFRAATHEPGSRKVMGKTYPQADALQAAAILKDLAAHPATARRLAHKIARHFVADEPSPALVATLEARWLETGGDLSAVAHALIDAPEAWEPAAVKLKTPYEFLISSWRAIGGQPGAIEHLAQPLNGMGQRAFSPPSPKGWDDVAAPWAAPDAVIKRLNWTEGFSAAVAGELDPNTIAAGALGGRLSEPVRKAVARAESREEALSILLMSPEFQRR